MNISGKYTEKHKQIQIKIKHMFFTAWQGRELQKALKLYHQVPNEGLLIYD